MSKAGVMFSELVVFLFIQLLGIYTASALLLSKPEIAEMPQISLLAFASIFAVSVIIMILAIKYLKHKFGFKMLFVFLIVIGSRTIFSIFFSDLIASILSLAVVAVWVALPYVAIHNFALVLAIAGISTELGFALSFSTVLILLAVLSVYDVIAVYQTKHMVKMFTGLMKKGLLLSLVIPIERSGWFARTDSVRPKKGFLLLGTGDIAFPLIFAITVLNFSMTSALFVAAGSTAGAAIVFYMLINQGSRKAIPALPPIAICSILGFLASLII